MASLTPDANSLPADEARGPVTDVESRNLYDHKDNRSTSPGKAPRDDTLHEGSGYSTGASHKGKTHASVVDVGRGPSPTTSTLAIHSTKLYTDLLDGCDWSEYIAAQAKSEKEQRARQLQLENERAEAAQRALLKEKSLQDARAIAEAKKAQRERRKEEEETRRFEERTAKFFSRQRAIHAAIVPLDHERRAHQHRVRAHLYEKWEKEVFLPIQTAINAEVEGATLSGATNTGTGVISQHEGAYLQGSVTDARREQLKEERRAAYLRESNKKERGLFLDTMDRAEYDPIAQREAATVRYTIGKGSGPTTTTTTTTPAGKGKGDTSKRENDAYFTVEQKEATEQQIKRDYVKLALAYREEELQSRTGVLSGEAGDAATEPNRRSGSNSRRWSSRGRGGQQKTLTVSQAARAAACPHNVADEQVVGRPPSPPPPAAFTAIRVGEAIPPPRRTHIPFNFDPSAGPVLPEACARHGASANGGAFTPSWTTPSALVASGSKGHPVKGSDGDRHVASHWRNISARTAGRTTPTLTGPAHVMPLPLIETPQEARQQHSKESLLACFGAADPSQAFDDGPSGSARHHRGTNGAAPSHREQSLPISQWETRRLRDTYFAHHWETDGDVKQAFCERKQWEGEMILDAQIRLT